MGAATSLPQNPLKSLEPWREKFTIISNTTTHGGGIRAAEVGMTTSLPRSS
jgi:hypothetical protein